MPAPSRFSHVVLASPDKERLVNWYCDALHGKVVFENAHIAFLTYDEEHHRLGVTQRPPNTLMERGVRTLTHLAYAYDSIRDLLEQYAYMKSLGNLPALATNHGPTISLYYKDPDGGNVEFFTDRFPTPEECTEFMSTPHFAANLRERTSGVPPIARDGVKPAGNGSSSE